MEEAPTADPIQPPPASWFSIWVKGTFRPSLVTYQEIAAHPSATAVMAHLWIAGASIAGYAAYVVLSIPITGITAMIIGQPFANSLALAMSNAITYLLCGLPFALIYSVGLFALGTLVTYKVAQMGGGKGSFGKLAFAFASYATPVIFLILALNVLGVYAFCFSAPVSIYGMALSVVAVRGVTGVGGGTAAAATLVRALVEVTLVGIFACLIILALVLLGPSIATGVYPLR